MSRAYRVSVSQSMTHHVCVDDRIEAKLEVLGILSPGRMAQLLGDALAERGFTVADGVAAREEGNVRVEVELVTGTVRVIATATDAVDIEVQRTINTYEEREQQMRDRVQAEVQVEVDRRKAAADRAAAQRAAEELEKVLAKVKPDLDAAVDAATRAALREKAASLGEILEVSENASGEMTIRVRV